MPNSKSRLFANVVIHSIECLQNVHQSDGINLLAHSVNSATAALNDRQPNRIIAATFLHDIGHLMEPDSDIFVEHADLGADWLSNYFGPDVTEPIRLHILAKRYLRTLDPNYNLDAFSLESLATQGGALTIAECGDFESHRYFSSALTVRHYDDRPIQSKAPLSVFHGILLTVLDHE